MDVDYLRRSRRDKIASKEEKNHELKKGEGGTLTHKLLTSVLFRR